MSRRNCWRFDCPVVSSHPSIWSHSHCNNSLADDSHITCIFLFYWPSILCRLYLYLTSHSIPVLSLSLSLAWPRLRTCHSSISSYQIWNNTSTCFFTHIYFLPPTSWKRQTTIYGKKRKSKIRKYLKVKKRNYWSEDEKRCALRHHIWLLSSVSLDLFYSALHVPLPILFVSFTHLRNMLVNVQAN